MRDQAILNTHPNVVEIINGKDYFDKDHNPVTLDEAKVNTELTKLQAEYNSKQYKRDRAVAYASLQDQADMQYWDAVNGTTLWQEHIAEIKAKHPKE